MYSDLSSTRREKVDFLQPGRDKERKWKHRKSLAWDTAFSTNPGVLEHDELFGSLKIHENDIDVNHKDSSIKILSCVSSEIARPSFAWDNAFFTEPGVLDAEELSLVNNGFITNTQLRKSADSMTAASEGSRFSVSTIEFDLFRDMRASLRNSPNVRQTGAREIQRKLPDGKMRTKLCGKIDQPSSLIPQPKVTSSSSKNLTPSQAKSVKKCVASELGRTKEKHKKQGFEEQSGSQSILRSSMKDLTSSSSGLRLPIPKMGFFDSEKNEEKENREPKDSEATTGTNRRTRYESKLEAEHFGPTQNSKVKTFRC